LAPKKMTDNSFILQKKLILKVIYTLDELKPNV
jgi:hypothetical protein